jgi:hypothetical protein
MPRQDGGSKEMTRPTVYDDCQFVIEFNKLSEEISEVSHTRGDWEYSKYDYQKMIAMLIVDLAECVKAFEKPGIRSVESRHFANIEIKLANIVITLMDISETGFLALGGAIIAKHDKNKKEIKTPRQDGPISMRR